VTRIQFFHGAQDRLKAAAQWIKSRYEAQLPVWVYSDNESDLDQLDRLLWTQVATGFIPHCRSGDKLQPLTPVVLSNSMEATSQDQCLLNLANDIPPGFSRFDELVEIVSTDDDDRLPGRERFRFYRERGYDLRNIDISNGLPA
jgi:DNA polymerase-3 subunit chi